MRIQKYDFGEMTIDGQVYDKDLIIFPEKIETNWWREEGHSLSLDDLESVLSYHPDILVIGRGKDENMQIPSNTEKALKDQNIEVLSGDTEKMSDAFNRLIDEGKNAVGAFHLTC